MWQTELRKWPNSSLFDMLNSCASFLHAENEHAIRLKCNLTTHSVGI